MASKQCDECKVSKHTSEFSGGSSTCKKCKKRGPLIPMAYYATMPFGYGGYGYERPSGPPPGCPRPGGGGGFGGPGPGGPGGPPPGGMGGGPAGGPPV